MSFIEIGRKIREARKSKKLTLKDLAQQSDVHFTTLSALERGAISEFGVRKLLRVANTLGLDLTLRPVGQQYTLDDVAAERRALRTQAEQTPLPLRVQAAEGGQVTIDASPNTVVVTQTGRAPARNVTPVSTNLPSFSVEPGYNTINKLKVLEAESNNVARSLNEQNKFSVLEAESKKFARLLNDQNKFSALTSLGSSTQVALEALTNNQLIKAEEQYKSVNKAKKQINTFTQVNELNKLKEQYDAVTQVNELKKLKEQYDSITRLKELTGTSDAVNAAKTDYSKYSSAVSGIDLMTRALGRIPDQAALVELEKLLKGTK